MTAALREQPDAVMPEPTPRRSAGHLLRVREVIAETADARTIVFDVPDDAAARFRYRPGQFLTLRIPLADGSAIARCYSLSSTPGLDAAPRVTVKRIDGGVGSTWLCESLSAGDELEVLPPSGVFTVPDSTQDLLLFAGGSGITPILSILRDALAHGERRVVLVYANRDESSVIFADDLRELAARHEDRLSVVHLLESVQGLPTRGALAAVTRLSDLATSTAFICGPGPFMEAVDAVLQAAGLPRDRIVIERFVSLTADPFTEPDLPDPEVLAAGDAVPLTVDLDGERHELQWPKRTTLLDFLRSQQIDAPFSCREGACSACACRLTAGRVRMQTNQVLDDTDLAEGWVLGCQSVLDGDDAVAITYD